MLGVLAICRSYKVGLLALASFLAMPAVTSASWLGYKNNTQAVIVVQTAATVNGRVIRGKPHTLYPGEVAWDNIAAPGMRQVAVYDPKVNNRLVAAENINIQNQDIFLSAQMVAQPQIPGRPAVPPQLRLIAIKAPVPPSGQAPKSDPQPKTPNQPIPKGPLPPSAKGGDTPKSPAPKSPTPQPKTPSPAPKGPVVPPKSPTPPPQNPPPTDPPKDAPKSKSG